MLKRTVARLLLFGVGFLLSYLITRPAPPNPMRRFVVCGYQDGERQIVIARDAAACADGAPPPAKSSRPGSVFPANSREPETDNHNEGIFGKSNAQAF